METEIRTEEDSSVSLILNMSQVDLGKFICFMVPCVMCPHGGRSASCSIPGTFPEFRRRVAEALGLNDSIIRAFLEKLEV